ncbi:unnamed protein product [Gordionus sp. m RMFG-2023]
MNLENQITKPKSGSLVNWEPVIDKAAHINYPLLDEQEIEGHRAGHYYYIDLGWAVAPHRKQRGKREHDKNSAPSSASPPAPVSANEASKISRRRRRKSRATSNVYDRFETQPLADLGN